MEINIKGNPGTGNTYVAVENGGVYNNNPNATSVTNITYNYNGHSTQHDATIDDEEKKKAYLVNNLYLRYQNMVDRDSAYEFLTRRNEQLAAEMKEELRRQAQEKEAEKQRIQAEKEAQRQAEREAKAAQREKEKQEKAKC